MSGVLCLIGGGGIPAPPESFGSCCWGAVNDTGCTCWRPHLTPRRRASVSEGPQAVRSELCHDCAYRPNSPERQERDGDQLDADPARPFHCHQGMPRPTHWTHPDTDQRHPGDPLDYQPVQRADRSWKADGRPADLCAGWAATAGTRPARPTED